MASMRALDCECGEHFEARNDQGLLDDLRRHAGSEHSDWTEADLKRIWVKNAYDMAPQESGV